LYTLVVPMSRHRLLSAHVAPHGERAGRAYDRLLALIVRGRLAPGARVQEAALALQLGVSRTPIRAALDRLARERFVVPASMGLRVELIVAPLTDADIRELWTLMGAIEGATALALDDVAPTTRRRLAAEMRATNDELAHLTLKPARQTDRIGEIMARFHVLFMEACAGPRLRTLHASILPHVQRYEWAFHAAHDYEPSIAEHAAICRKIESGDPKRLRAHIESHWANGMQRRLEQARRATVRL
jgi:DNA-binding GntR family transcriptional regulator